MVSVTWLQSNGSAETNAGLQSQNGTGQLELQARFRPLQRAEARFFSQIMNATGANVSATGQPPGPEMIDQVTEPLGLRIVRLALYVIIFVIATFGNSLVIFVVYKTRELHTGESSQLFIGKRPVFDPCQLRSNYCITKLELFPTTCRFRLPELSSVQFV